MHYRGKVSHQLVMANHKVKELVTKRGEAYERLQHWLQYNIFAYIMYIIILCGYVNSSQVVPMRHDLDQLQVHLQRQQEKYDNDLSRMNDVRIVYLMYLHAGHWNHYNV